MNPRSFFATCSRKLHHSPHQRAPATTSDYDHLSKLDHRDWLAPNEILKIIHKLRHPTSILTLLNRYGDRKDYKPNEALYALAIDRLAKAGMFDDVEGVMRRIREEKACRLSDEFFYDVIKVYGNVAGWVDRAVDTLFDMPRGYSVWPSVKTFNFVLNLLVNSRSYDAARDVYVRAPQLGVKIDACCLNILVKGLCQNGNLGAAFEVLDEFPKQGCKPDVKTYSTIMKGLCEQGKVDDANHLLRRMEDEDVWLDTIVFNIIISGLRKKGRVDEGMEILERMKVKGCSPNAGSYQEVLYGLIDEKRFVEAKEFMGAMIGRGINPSYASYRKVIHGLCKRKMVEDLDWVLKQMVEHGFVPRMGLWRKMVRCMLSSAGCSWDISIQMFSELILES